MEYELKNPSDPYTFMAADLEVAALVVFSISTLYGAEPKEGDGDVPIFIFGGAAEWYQESFGRTPDDGLIARKLKYSHAAGERWKVMCFGCTAGIDPGYAKMRHIVQQMWNKRA